VNELIAIYVTLVLVRVGLFITVLPLLGGQQTPRMVKVGLAVALTVLWTITFLEQAGSDAMVQHAQHMSWLRWVVALGREAILGALFGFTFSLFLVPARIAGEFIAQEIGLAFANEIAASSGATNGPLTVIFDLLATLMYLGLDLHHLFLSVLYSTFRLFPVGQSFALPTTDVVGQTASAQEWGVGLGGPVLLCLFLATVVLALLNRAAPQINLYTVGFPLRMIVGLAALLLFLPQLLASLVAVFERCSEMLARMG
jgi:flagellar biosynthetic protein FliR